MTSDRTTRPISKPKKPALCLALLFAARLGLFAQAPAADDALLSDISTRLDQPGGDTARQFILEKTRAHCGGDFGCLSRNYQKVMVGFERRFNLPSAIFIAGEMARIAEQKGDLNKQADAHNNLNRYHDALGNDRLAIIHLEKARDLYEKAGNQSAALRARMGLAEGVSADRDPAEVLTELEAMLAEAVENRDTLSTTHLHLRLIDWSKKAGRLDRMEAHVSALEKALPAEPFKPLDCFFAINAAHGRGDLFMFQKNWAAAEPFYQRALGLCHVKPDRWQEIYVMHQLAKLEWARGDARSAKSYLDSAFVRAEKLGLHDHLATNFDLKATIAEAEGRFADALLFTKKKLEHQNAFDDRGAGFNQQSYFLEVEKERQAVELRLKNRLLNSFLVIAFLAALLAAGLFTGLRKQRKARRELAAQNALISRQAEQLRSLDEAKSRFFANVSHELRTPLTLVVGPIRSLLEGQKPPEQQEKLLKMADQSGRRLQQLVDEILDFQKLETGKLELREESTELPSFFARHAAEFESLAASRRIDLSFSTAIEKGTAARIDCEKCRQILYNLLSNALKFTPAGGRVSASLSLDGGLLKIEVADTGPGIHPDDLPRIFDRYFQTARPDKLVEGGTGIGLALCREYAQLLGGRMEAESILKVGSVFRAAFPVEVLMEKLAAGEAEGQVFQPIEEGEKLAAGPANGQRPTILIVEDNPDLQAYIGLVLRERFNVVLAGNGQEAIERLASLPDCQLVVSDLMMPVMDGYQLLEKLKSGGATRLLPVVMLTARAEARDRLRALRIGVDDYLTKPFDEEELIARIENLLKNKAARQEETMLAAPEEDKALSENDRAWLEKFERHVAENLSSDILSVPQLASDFAMSESTLLRQLKRLTGLSPLQYLTEMRLDAARGILESRSGRSMASIAAAVGYGDARSFARLFKERFGRAPSEFIS